MIQAELRGLLSRKLRTVLTMVAIVLGISMISGTYILTDAINTSFNQIFKQSTAHIAAVVIGRDVISAALDGQPPPVPASLLPIIQRVPGVAAADGEIADNDGVEIFGPVIRTRDGHTSRQSLGAVGSSPNIVFGVGNQQFNSLTKVRGSWPHGYQIALDDGTMSRHGLRLGQTVYIVTANHPIHTFTIVGATRFGIAASIGGATLIDMDLRTAQLMTAMPKSFVRISAMATRGFTQREVARAIRARIPRRMRSTVIVRTGVAQAAASASEIGKDLNFLTILLLAFAGVAVFVGAFIIFNTFSITVAQRAREFALLRTIGASRGQILRAVISEALLVGVIASLLGLFAGLGTAEALDQLFKVFGADLPSGALVYQPRTVIVALAVGVIITALSALMPALKATRVPPIAALKAAASQPRGRTRLTAGFSVLAVVLALLLTTEGMYGSIGPTGTRLLVIGTGCILLFLGVAMFTPRLVRPLAWITGWPIIRFSAVTGRLARDNATRNPSRTAVTSAALMIGLALVGFVTIFAAEIERTANDAVNHEVAGAFIIENPTSPQNTISPTAIRQIGRLPGVSLATGVADGAARVRGIGDERVDGVDPAAFGDVYRFQWVAGTSRTLLRLGNRDALIDDSFADSHHLRVGSSLHLLTSSGVHASFTVFGIYRASVLLDPVVIPLPVFRLDWHQPDVLVVAVNTAKGARPRSVENTISNALNANFPSLSVSSQAQYKSEQDAVVNQLLSLIYVLLGLSIVVSLFGIVNTLVLSIYERAREIAMLRAIGASKRQVRWMIRWESVITSLIGAVLGLVLGTVLAMLITVGLRSDGIELAFPVVRLFEFLVLAVVFGIVAAAFPARRAAGLDILQALAYE